MIASVISYFFIAVALKSRIHSAIPTLYCVSNRECSFVVNNISIYSFNLDLFLYIFQILHVACVSEIDLIRKISLEIVHAYDVNTYMVVT